LNQEEANQINIKINAIANNLEDQSQKLINLKSQQQELLKDSHRI